MHRDPRLALVETRLLAAIAKAGGQKIGGGGKLQAYGYAGKYVASGGSGARPLVRAGEGTFSRDEQKLFEAGLRNQREMAKIVMLANMNEKIAKEAVVTETGERLFIMAQGNVKLKLQMDDILLPEIKMVLAQEQEQMLHGTLDGQHYLSREEIMERFPGDAKTQDWMLQQKAAMDRKVQYIENVMYSLSSDLYMSPRDIMDLYNRHGVTAVAARYAAQKYVDQWAETSADSNGTSIALQMVAAERFGVSSSALDWAFEKSSWGKDRLTSDTQRALDREGLVMDAFVQATYNRTQDLFKAAGITEIALIRGMNAETHLQSGEYRLSPLNAMTVDVYTATNFGSQVIVTSMPVERIYSSWMTGPGCKGEHEFIVIGSDKPDAFVVHDAAEVDAVMTGDIKETSYIGMRYETGALGEGEGGYRQTYEEMQTRQRTGVAQAEPGISYSIKPQSAPSGFELKQVTTGTQKGKWKAYKKPAKKPPAGKVKHVAPVAIPGQYYANKPKSKPPGYALVQLKAGKQKGKWKAVNPKSVKNYESGMLT